MGNEGLGLSIEGVEIGAVWASVIGGRLEPNLIRRSSLIRAKMVSSDGGCCNCFNLLEQNFT